MSSRGCSPTATSTKPLFQTSTPFDSEQHCFDLDLHKETDQGYTLVLPSNASFSDMSMQLEYDKSGDIISPTRSAIGTPTTSSSDGEYISTKLSIPSEIVTSSSVGSPESEVQTNGIHSNDTGYQNGTLNKKIRDSFSPPISSPPNGEYSESQSLEIVADIVLSPKHYNGSLHNETESHEKEESGQSNVEITGNDVEASEEVQINEVAESQKEDELESSLQNGSINVVENQITAKEEEIKVVAEVVIEAIPEVVANKEKEEETTVVVSPLNIDEAVESTPTSPLIIEEVVESKEYAETDYPKMNEKASELSMDIAENLVKSPEPASLSDNLISILTSSSPANNMEKNIESVDMEDITPAKSSFVSEEEEEDKAASICLEEKNKGVDKKEEENNADNSNSNSISDTIQKVASREKELAKKRKAEEEEEAARTNFSSNFFENNKKFRKQNNDIMVQLDEPLPEASISNVGEESEGKLAALPPLEPIDTDVVDSSTPLVTPSEDNASITSASQSKPVRRRRERATPSVFCGYEDKDKGKCKQRAILQFQYCIRHILSDTTAPYKRCQHHRRAKSKKEEPVQCTNAIGRDLPEIYCTTHLIMKGLREPKKKKKTAADDASTISVDGSESFTEPSAANQSQLLEDVSMHSFNDDSQLESQSFNGYEQSSQEQQWSSQQSQNGFSQQSFEQQQQHPSTSYFTPDSQQPMSSYTPNSEMSQPIQQSHSYQLIQKPNGEQILIDEFGTPQPPGSYNLIQGPNGTLQATFIQNGGVETPQTPRSSSGFPSQTPPSSAPPTFGENTHEFRRPSMPSQTQRFQSVDSTPQKAFEHSPFPSQSPSVGLQPNQIAKQHPQLSARLNSSHSSTSSTPFDPNQIQQQSQFIVQPAHNFQAPNFQPAQLINGAAYNEILIQQPDGTFIQAPQIIDHSGMEMPPPPLPPSRTQSRSISTPNAAIPPSNIRTIITFPNGQSQMLPPGTRIITNENGTSAIIPGGQMHPEESPMQIIQQQQPQVINPENALIGNRAPYPFLHFERPPKYLKPENVETDSEDEESKMLKDYGHRKNVGARKDKMICLRQKRQRMRIGGSFRKIPLVDEMAKVLENHDFDKTDLFPLGLEPSDDDVSSEDDCLEVGPRWWPSNGRPRNTAVEVYLQKKVLKLEKSKLIKNAIITAPLMTAAKIFPNSAGAALRTRDHHRRGLSRPENKPFRERRCYHMQSISDSGGVSRRTVRCTKPCLPRANHCSDHILYNIDQKLFDYCNREGCSRPVLPSEAVITDGLCRHHYDQQEIRRREQQQQQQQQIQQQQFIPPSRPSSARYIVAQYPPTAANVTQFDNSPTVLSSATTVLRTSVNAYATSLHPQNQLHQQSASSLHQQHQQTHCFEDSSTSGMFYDNHHFEGHQDNDDVSLASVAKDLGLNSEALNEVLAQVGEDEPMQCDDDEDGLLDDEKDNLDLGHNWADVESFLLSEGYQPDNNVDGDIPSNGFVDDDPTHGFVNASAGFGASSAAFDNLIYHDLH